MSDNGSDLQQEDLPSLNALANSPDLEPGEREIVNELVRRAKPLEYSANPAQANMDAKGAVVNAVSSAIGAADRLANKAIDAVPSMYDTFDPKQPVWRRYLGMFGEVPTLLKTGAKLSDMAVKGYQGIDSVVKDKTGVNPHLGDLSSLLLPANDPAGVGLLGMGEVGKMFPPEASIPHGAQLPMDISIPNNSIRPGVEKTLRTIGSGQPFEPQAEALRLQDQTLGLHQKLGEISGLIDNNLNSIGDNLTKAGANAPVRNAPDIGEALRADVSGNRAAMKEQLVADRMNFINKIGDKGTSIPVNMQNTLRGILSDSSNAAAIDIPGDANLRSILGDLQNESATSMTGDQGAAWSLQKKLNTYTDLNEHIARGTDNAGWSTKKAALLGDLKGSLWTDVEQSVAKDPKAASRLELNDIKDRWASFFRTFDNPDINNVLKTDDSSKIFDKITSSEQGFKRLNVAASQDIYNETVNKKVSELMENVRTSPTPLTTLESFLRDPSGIEVARQFTPEQKAAMRGAAQGYEIDRTALQPQFKAINDQLENMAKEGMSRRQGEGALARLGGRDITNASKDTTLKDIGSYFNAHKIKYSVAGGLSVMLGLHHPYAIAATMAAAATPDMFAHMYASNPAFRGAVHAFIDAPSLAAREGAALALQNATKAFVAEKVVASQQGNQDEAK